jgi:hypothetical protein
VFEEGINYYMTIFNVFKDSILDDLLEGG